MDRTQDIQDLKLYTLTEIEPILGVSHQTLLRYVKAGKLKATKIEGKWKVTRGDIEKFIERK
jgi:excisionase family DNA binding protein